MVYQAKNKKIGMLIKDTLGLLNKGSNLKDAFSTYPKIFLAFDLSIIEM
jgi:hypothetical protein